MIVLFSILAMLFDFIISKWPRQSHLMVVRICNFFILVPIWGISKNCTLKRISSNPQYFQYHKFPDFLFHFVNYAK